MRKSYLKVIFYVAISMLLLSCAGKKPLTKKDLRSTQAVVLNTEIQAGEYEQKVDAFMIILDKSGSMGELYKGKTKLSIARDIVSRMNQTIAGLDVKGALRAFGQGKDTTLLYGLTDYAASGFKEGLDKATHADGNSPLYAAIEGAENDLESASGNIALIIFSDARKLNKVSTIASAKKIKKAFGDRICIYTVLIGNDKAGGEIMKEIAETGSCGFATNADSIMGAQDMADFSRKVFFGGPVVSAAPASWVLAGVEFEFASSSISSDSYSILDESVETLKKNPSCPNGIRQTDPQYHEA